MRMILTLSDPDQVHPFTLAGMARAARSRPNGSGSVMRSWHTMIS
jgi:hypothetical protein